jgi:Transposase DNA-binding/Transposase DDE domain
MLYQADYSGYFGDIRLERRGGRLLERLFHNGTKSLQAIALTRAEQKGFYHLLRSEKVSEQKLVEELAARCAKAATDKVVLAIQDTTEVNLGAHQHRIDLQSGIGRLDSPYAADVGFKLHPSIVVDACSYFPLGIADVYVWDRPMDKYEKGHYKQLPIAQKESRKWLKVSEHTKTCLQQAAAIVIVQDREGDIFEQFKAVADDHTFLLVRSRGDRNLQTGGKLYQQLSAAARAGSYELLVDSDSHRKTPARKVVLEVRFAPLELAAPKSGKYKGSPQLVYGVEAKEVSSEPALPPGVEPVHWRLLTTWPVHDYQTARRIIEWYTCRWLIEQVFSMLKKEGFDIEASELEQGWAIRKLSIMILDTIMRLLQMYLAYQMPEGEDVDINVCFDQQQQQCLGAVNSQAVGKTAALTNPHQPAGLKWAVWVIARLGGWKGYRSQHPPGLTTLSRGLCRFCQLYDGWVLLLNTT